MENYSVQAVLSATDKGFTNAMNGALGSLSGIEPASNRATSSILKIATGIGVFKAVSAATNMLKNSIDGAVSRYDTLNRFPKMLVQLGYSTNEATAATNKLSNGIQGLPTKLDDVVSTAQNLTILTGNLEKSTDTTLALNNAFLASGSTSADASRGLNQYVQMLSKGEVDMQSWRTLQETMGYALNETAKAFGFAGEAAQNDLYAALKSGKITFNEFNDKIIELNNATGGFAEVAKTATGGINTAWANMQTAVVRGTTSIIGAIDSGFSQTRFGSIQNIIEGFGGSFESVLKGVATVIEPAIANIDSLASVAVGLGAAFGVYKIIQTCSSALEKVKEASALAEAAHSELTITLGKNSTSALRLASSQATLEAKTKAETAVAKQSHAEKLKLVAAEKSLAVELAKEAAETSKSTAQKTLETKASKLAKEASQAELKAKRALAEASRDGASAEAKETAEKLKLTAARKKEESAAAAERAQSQKTAETKNLEAQATKLTTEYTEANTTARKAQEAATTAQVQASKAAAAAQNEQNVSLTLGQSIIGLFTGKVGVHTVTTTLASTATNLFGTALKALPMVGVMAAITGVVSWLTSLITKTDVAKDKIKEINETFDDNKTKAEANAIAAERLVDELDRLESQGMKTNAEQIRYAQIVGELNKLMPDLNLEIDENTKRIKEGTDAIRTNIEALRDQYVQQAFMEKVSGLIQEQAEAVVRLTEKEAELSKAEDERATILGEISKMSGVSISDLEKLNLGMGTSIEAMAEMLGISEESLPAFGEYFSRLIDIAIETDGLSVAVSDCKNEVNSFDEQIDEASDTQEYYAGKMAESEEAASTMAETTQTAIGTIAEAYDTLEDVQKEALDGIKNAYETMTGSLSDLSQKIERDSEQTWSKVKDNQDNVIAETKTFSDLYSQLINAGVSESYLNAIGATGPEAIPLLQGMLDSGIDEVKSKQSEWEDAYSSIGDSFTDSFEFTPDMSSKIRSWVTDGVVGSLKDSIERADLNSLGEQAGKAVPQGLENGVMSGVTGVISATTGLGKDGIENVLRAVLEWNSPSGLAKRAGQDFDLGLALGLEGGMPSVQSAIQKITDTMKKGLEDAGKNAGTGMAAGMSASFLTLGPLVSRSLVPATNAVKNWTQTSQQTMSSGMANINSVVTSGFSRINTTAGNAMQTFSNTVKAKTAATFVLMYSEASNGMNQFSAALSNGFSTALHTVSNGCSHIASTAAALEWQMYNVGINAMYGMANGIYAGSGSALSAARNVANQVAATIRSALQVRSPSRITTKIGQFVSKGLGGGILGLLGFVDKASDKLAAAAIPDIPTMDLGIADSVNRLSSSMNSTVTHEISNAGNRLPGNIILQMGDKMYKAFVGDITDVQDQAVRLDEIYSLG